MQHFNKFPGFDEDKTSVGAAILWYLNECLPVKSVNIEKPGTEELIPTVQDNTPKKKRDPSRWVRNIKKAKMNAGQSFSYVIKRGTRKGKEVKRAEKKMSEGCGQKCYLKCTEKYNEEQRKQIFEDYWSLDSIDKKRHFIVGRVTSKEKERERKREYKKKVKGRNR